MTPALVGVDLGDPTPPCSLELTIGVVEARVEPKGHQHEDPLHWSHVSLSVNLRNLALVDHRCLLDCVPAIYH
jgi:hypothetical protein